MLMLIRLKPTLWKKWIFLSQNLEVLCFVKNFLKKDLWKKGVDWKLLDSSRVMDPGCFMAQMSFIFCRSYRSETKGLNIPSRIGVVFFRQFTVYTFDVLVYLQQRIGRIAAHYLSKHHGFCGVFVRWCIVSSWKCSKNPVENMQKKGFLPVKWNGCRFRSRRQPRRQEGCHRIGDLKKKKWSICISR